MLDANYQRHLKIIGKNAYLYDYAGLAVASLKLLRATTYDQVADGTDESAPGVDVLSQYRSRWNSVVDGGPVAQRALALAIATTYMTGTDFTDDLTTQPTSRSIANVIAALETEMSAGVDNKTLGDVGAVGLAHFFNALKGSSGTWNTEDDSTADYRDAVYVTINLI